MATATLTSKDQITVPKEVREHLDLSPGDIVEFAIGADGGVEFCPLAGSVEELRGMVAAKAGETPSLDQLERTLFRSLAADDHRIRQRRGPRR